MSAPVEIQIGRGGVNISFGSMNEDMDPQQLQQFLHGGYAPLGYNNIAPCNPPLPLPANQGNKVPLHRKGSLPTQSDVNRDPKWGSRQSDYL